MSKQRPILFSTPMVQAILEGRKRMTRRKVKGLALEWLRPDMFTREFTADPQNGMCPYGKIGDILWVRETWALGHSGYVYKTEDVTPLRWRPSIHMPKEAARIWLQIEDVSIERLQDITEEDAKAEGVIQNRDGSWHDYIEPNRLCQDDAKASFISLWESINGPESWKLNPWVWVLKFKKIEKP